jgi:hypothetical protein
MQAMVSVDGCVDSIPRYTPSEASCTDNDGIGCVAAAWRLYFQYIASVFRALPQLQGLDAQEYAFRDHVQLPLQARVMLKQLVVCVWAAHQRQQYSHWEQLAPSHNMVT